MLTTLQQKKLVLPLKDLYNKITVEAVEKGLIKNTERVVDHSVDYCVAESRVIFTIKDEEVKSE